MILTTNSKQEVCTCGGALLQDLLLLANVLCQEGRTLPSSCTADGSCPGKPLLSLCHGPSPAIIGCFPLGLIVLCTCSCVLQCGMR